LERFRIIVSDELAETAIHTEETTNKDYANTRVTELSAKFPSSDGYQIVLDTTQGRQGSNL
jgi:hypothetical protein